MNRILPLILFVICCNLSHKATARDYYQRHYIVLVDQTSASMQEDADGLQEIGRMLSNLFLNVNLMEGVDTTKINATETYLSDLLFNPETDEVSVFRFGTTGHHKAVDDSKYGLGRIRKKVRGGEMEIQAVTNELITPVAMYHKTGKDIHAFIQDYFIPLFCGDSMYASVNLSSIVYPCILKLIETKPAAAEYYIIIVSNFKVIGYNDNRDDYGLMVAAMPDNTHSLKLSKQLWQLKSPFYTSELMKIQSLKDKNDIRNARTHIKAVKAFCYKLGLKSLQGISAHVTSNINMKQLSYKGLKFSLSPTSIAFPHDNTLEINRIELVVTDNGGNVIHDMQINNAEFDTIEMRYCMPTMEISFEEMPKIGDRVHFNFVFYTTPKDPNGGRLLPFVFPVEHEFEFKHDNFKNPSIISVLMIIAFVLVIAMISVALSFLIKNGKGNKKLIVNLEHSDADEGTLQQVSKDRGALLLKCDYPQKGVTNITYTLQGHFKEIKRMALPWFVNYIYVRASLSNDSSEGMTVHIVDAKEDGWMPVIVKDGNVTINLQVDYDNCPDEVKYVKVHLQWSYEPRFLWHQKKAFKKCGVKSVVSEGDFIKSFKEYEDSFNAFLDREDVKLSCNDGDDVIENFIREPFNYPDHWVGIDPGTSGSCVTLGYGVMGNAGKPNIIRVPAQDTSGRDRSITNSLLVLGGSSFNPTSSLSLWQPDIDYGYGVKAYERLDQYINEGAYCIQSIKKLLGYKKGGSDGKINVKIGNNEYKFTGLDLQRLLVKALVSDMMDKYVTRLNNDNRLVQQRNNLFPNMSVDRSIFERAVVTIPNNYQLPQILDMVESVKSNGFKEVKYIYEPEGILFHYLKNTFNDHKADKTEIIIVYDMGGATINSTVFKVDIKMEGDQPQYHVSTLSRLGYAVGGDDIDYAIIEYLMHFGKINSLFKNDDERFDKQDENKTKIIGIAQKLKIAIVQKETNNVDEYDGSLDNKEQFVATYLNDIIQIIDSTKTFMVDDLSDSEKNRLTIKKMSFFKSLRNDLLSSEWIKEYVLNKVEDAVLDMIHTPDVQKSKKIDKIIYSGRSTLFPGIKDTVNKCLKDNNLNPKDKDGGSFLKGDLKSPVADGACWYGIYEGKIVYLDNSRVTSSYGMCFTRPGENPYVEMITQNSRYDENKTQIERSTSVKSKFQSDAGHVNFYQVMGALNHGDSLFSENNRHKVRFLTSIYLGGSEAKKETITVCANGIVKCDVDYLGKPPHQEAKTTEFDTRDITKENARPYLFSISEREPHRTTNNGLTVGNTRTPSKEKQSGKHF